MNVYGGDEDIVLYTRKQNRSDCENFRRSDYLHRDCHRAK